MLQDTKTRKAVLIADDEGEIREVIREFFKAEFPGVLIVEASDGADAYMRASRQKFDLVITDLRMPRKNGVQFLQQMTNGLAPEFRPNGFIVISALIQPDKLSEMRSANIRALSKPFTDEELKTLVLEIFAHKAKPAATE